MNHKQTYYSMLTILHGEDNASSRNYLFSLKKASKEYLVLDGQSITPTDLQQAVSGKDLFGNQKDIFIDNLFSKRKSPKEIEALTAVINANPDTNIILWESKELTKKQLHEFKNITNKEFRVPSTIFALLDALKPGNGKQLLELFQKTLKDKDAEFVLVMLQRQVRILLAFSVIASKAKQSNVNNEIAASQAPRNDVPISEVSRLAPWQKGKLQKQAGSFSTEQLIAFHTKLFELEKGMKTGGLSQSLANEVDFLLLSL